MLCVSVRVCVCVCEDMCVCLCAVNGIRVMVPDFPPLLPLPLSLTADVWLPTTKSSISFSGSNGFVIKIHQQQIVQYREANYSARTRKINTTHARCWPCTFTVTEITVILSWSKKLRFTRCVRICSQSVPAYSDGLFSDSFFQYVVSTELGWKIQ